MNRQKGFAKVKMQLAGCKVERWLVLPESMVLEDFHDTIQAAFGWGHSHLWSFKAKGGTEYKIPSDDYFGLMPLFRESPRDASKYTLFDLLPKCDAKAKYIYDFGDNWVHIITRMPCQRRLRRCASSRLVLTAKRISEGAGGGVRISTLFRMARRKRWRKIRNSQRR